MASRSVSILLMVVIIGVVVTQVYSKPSRQLAKEMGFRGEQLDKKVQEIDKMIVKNWDDLIGPLSDADKQAFRRQYPDEAAEYDKITTAYGWPKKF